MPAQDDSIIVQFDIRRETRVGPHLTNSAWGQMDPGSSSPDVRSGEDFRDDNEIRLPSPQMDIGDGDQP